MATLFSKISVNRVEPTEASYGDSVRVFVPVTYITGREGEYFTVYAAIGNERTLFFDEILFAERRYYFLATPIWATVTVYVDIPITEKISLGTYDVYAKVKEPNFVSETLLNCITIVGIPEAAFSNLVATYRRA